jgi:hypothetical protein
MSSLLCWAWSGTVTGLIAGPPAAADGCCWAQLKTPGAWIGTLQFASRGDGGGRRPAAACGVSGERVVGRSRCQAGCS